MSPNEGCQWQNLLGCDHWVLAGTPRSKMVVFRDLVGVAIATVSKKLNVKWDVCKNLADSFQLILSPILNQGAQKIESALKTTGNGLEYVGKRLNLFNALNNIAKLKSKVPNYVLGQSGQLQPAKHQQTGTI